jgi:hypothetical protein
MVRRDYWMVPEGRKPQASCGGGAKLGYHAGIYSIPDESTLSAMRLAARLEAMITDPVLGCGVGEDWFSIGKRTCTIAPLPHAERHCGAERTGYRGGPSQR